MPFINIAEPPPKNPEYLVPFNTLLKECWKRGIGLALMPKEIGASILQSDLDGIRSAILVEYDFFFVPEQLNPELPEPFEEADAHPKFNDGKGFLLMPDRYTSTGRNIFKSGILQPMGENVPLLFTHFTDLATILNSLRFRRFDYRLDFKFDRNKLTVNADFSRGTLDSIEQDSDYRETENRISDTRTLHYNAVPLGKNAAEVRYGFYFRTADGNWQKLNEGNPSVSGTGKIDIDIVKLAECVQHNVTGEWGGNCELQPFVEIVSDFVLEEDSAARIFDDQKNGVAIVNSCTPCCSLTASSYKYVQDSLNQYFGDISLPLAMSSAITGLVIGHYMWKFDCAGASYGYYNCDTRVETVYSGTQTDETGVEASWNFCELKRPKGAWVLFALLGSAAGSPMNSLNYRMRQLGEKTYSVWFDDEKVEQLFVDHELQRCELRTGTMTAASTIPGAEVTRLPVENVPDQYEFSSPPLPLARISVDKRGVSQLEFPSIGSSSARQTAADKTIAGIACSTDPDAAGEFDFADFYLLGQKPDFGTPESGYVMDFKDEAEQLLGKYIELRHDTGIVTKGFWNREEGALLPAELSVIERTADDASGNFLETVRTVKYGTEGRGEAVSRAKKRYFLGRENVVEEYRNYGAADELRRVFSFGDDPQDGNYGKLTFDSGFNGEWRRCEYDADGRLVKEVTPFMDSAPEEPENSHNVTLYSYEPHHSDEEVSEFETRVRMIVRRTLGQETGRSYRLYFPSETREITAAAPGAACDAPANRVTKRYSYSSGTFAGRPWKTENADGTSSVTTYREIGDSLETTTESGFLPDHGVRTVSVMNARGNVASTRTYDIGTGLPISGGDSTYDRYGRVLTQTTIDGEVTATEYNCCGPRFVTQPDGGTAEYAYDVFSRLKFEDFAGITTWHTYDADNNEIRTTVTGKEGGELVTVREYDADGELIREENPAGAETRYARGSGWELVTDALGGTQRTEYYRDGNTKRVSGTAAFPVEYQYGVESNERTATQFTSPSGWVKSFTNFLGQQYKTLYPDGFTETTGFDAFGRPVANENSDGLKQLTVYDPASGNVKYQVVKHLDDSDEIDWLHDSVTRLDSGYLEREGEVYGFSESSLYLDGAFTAVSRTETRRDGRKTVQTSNGRTDTRLTVFEGDGLVRTTGVAFDGATQTDETENGILLSSTHSVLGETTYAYDQFNRGIGNDHAANGVTLTVRTTLDAAGNILSQTETAGTRERTTSYAWDLLGRQVSSTTPEGVETVSTYTARGELATMAGGVYRQTYEYDAQGRQLKLTTWRNDNAPEETFFEYDDRGRRTRKTYADNTSELWSWRGDGRMASHTNVRGQTLTYHYSLSGELAALDGAGLHVEYDRNGRITQLTDRAGTRSFSYDSYGKVRVETVPNVPGKELSRNYDDKQRLSGFRLESTRYSYVCFSADVIRCVRRISETETRTTLEFAMGAWEDRVTLAYQPLNTIFELGEVRYDDYGRPEGSPYFNDDAERLTPYLIEEQPAEDGPATLYHYGEEDGRLQQIETGGNILNYAYLCGSGQVESRDWRDRDDVSFLELACAYDEYLRLVRIDRDGTPAIGYTLNADNQRTQATLSDGSVWSYSYDTKSQLTGAVRGTANAMSYAYDGIGNRLTAEEDGAGTVYTANDLNWYTAINAEAPAYDTDGNMLSWNGWSYTWNTENRLIAAEKGSVRFEADYDFMGRRFEKKIYENGVLTRHEKYAYDGYKLVAIFDALDGDALRTTFTWQPVDLDTPLAMTHNGETFYYVTDGNKNVIQLLRADKTEAATYTYAPFGGVLEQEGALAQTNPFRFSSEFHDDETGLVYYNYRYYNPVLGRWTKRDPIEEDGGVNLYGGIQNNLITRWDNLGLVFTTWDMVLPPKNDAIAAIAADKDNPLRMAIAESMKGCCGKDITKQLNSLLRNVKNKLLSSLYYRSLIWHNPYSFNILDGWDIRELYTNDERLHAGSSGSACARTVAYGGKCVKMTSLNYILWGLLAAIKDYAIFPSRFSRLTHWAAALAYSEYKASFGNDENEPRHIARGRLGFTLVGMRYYHTGKVDIDDSLCIDLCRVNKDNVYQGKLTAHVRVGFFSNQIIPVTSD